MKGNTFQFCINQVGKMNVNLFKNKTVRKSFKYLNSVKNK